MLTSQLSMRLTEEEKEQLEKNRVTLGLRSESEVVRMALSLMKKAMEIVEVSSYGPEIALRSMFQEEEQLIKFAARMLEENPHWQTIDSETRERIIEKAKSLD